MGQVFTRSKTEGGEKCNGAFKKGMTPADAAAVDLDQARRDLLPGILSASEPTRNRRALRRPHGHGHKPAPEPHAPSKSIVAPTTGTPASETTPPTPQRQRREPPVKSRRPLLPTQKEPMAGKNSSRPELGKGRKTAADWPHHSHQGPGPSTRPVWLLRISTSTKPSQEEPLPPSPGCSWHLRLQRHNTR